MPSKCRRRSTKRPTAGTSHSETRIRIGETTMTLFERIAQDITAAMRARDPARPRPLRVAKAALMNREVEKGRALEDAEAEQVITALIKQRRDSIEQFAKGGRQDLVAKEAGEGAVL